MPLDWREGVPHPPGSAAAGFLKFLVADGVAELHVVHHRGEGAWCYPEVSAIREIAGAVDESRTVRDNGKRSDQIGSAGTTAEPTETPLSQSAPERPEAAHAKGTAKSQSGTLVSVIGGMVR